MWNIGPALINKETLGTTWIQQGQGEGMKPQERLLMIDVRMPCGSGMPQHGILSPHDWSEEKSLAAKERETESNEGSRGILPCLNKAFSRMVGTIKAFHTK